jgi:hypothetical protein
MAYLRNKSMEFLKRFEVPAKNPSEDAQRRWREAVGTLVKNRRRRFRMVPDLDKRSQVQAQRRNIQVRTYVAPPPQPRFRLTPAVSFIISCVESTLYLFIRIIILKT